MSGAPGCRSTLWRAPQYYIPEWEQPAAAVYPLRRGIDPRNKSSNRKIGSAFAVFLQWSSNGSFFAAPKVCKLREFRLCKIWADLVGAPRQNQLVVFKQCHFRHRVRMFSCRQTVFQTGALYEDLSPGCQSKQNRREAPVWSLWLWERRWYQYRINQYRDAWRFRVNIE